MNRRNVAVVAAVLIFVMAVSLFVILDPLHKVADAKKFYVGVDFSYGNQFSQLKALVDRVKNFTNLFIIGVDISYNHTALDESADYIYTSGLYFMVFFTSYPTYEKLNTWQGTSIFNWMQEAPIKYGDKFLGIYRFDEPGGNQIDSGNSQLISQSIATGGYNGVAESYVGNLSSIVNYYRTNGGGVQVFTSDYALYWFDYAASYDTVFCELTGNQSRFSKENIASNESKQEIVALNRGAAQSFNRNWGIIVTWQYNQTPYLESGSDLYNDLAQAYCNGATYALVFDYPNITVNGVVNPYGILTDDHFGNMSKFWSDIQNDKITFTPSPAEAIYILPKDYGFGFRTQQDSIWGFFPPDALTPKIWKDTQFLVAKYSYNLNIIYDDPKVVTDSTLRNYKVIYYYNQTVT